MVERKDVHQDYFEGTIQLRNPTPELIAYVKHYVESSGAWISKEKKVNGGIDLRVSSQKILRRLPEKIKARFNGISKLSNTLFSKDRQTQKNIYRVTVLFRLASFTRGDIFEVRGKQMEILKIAEKVQLKEIDSGKKHLYPFEEVEEASLRQN